MIDMNMSVNAFIYSYGAVTGIIIVGIVLSVIATLGIIAYVHKERELEIERNWTKIIEKHLSTHNSTMTQLAAAHNKIRSLDDFVVIKNTEIEELESYVDELEEINKQLKGGKDVDAS